MMQTVMQISVWISKGYLALWWQYSGAGSPRTFLAAMELFAQLPRRLFLSGSSKIELREGSKPVVAGEGLWTGLNQFGNY